MTVDFSSLAPYWQKKSKVSRPGELFEYLSAYLGLMRCISLKDYTYFFVPEVLDSLLSSENK